MFYNVLTCQVGDMNEHQIVKCSADMLYHTRLLFENSNHPTNYLQLIKYTLKLE